MFPDDQYKYNPLLIYKAMSDPDTLSYALQDAIPVIELLKEMKQATSKDAP
jgi:hypothetical protein